MEPLLAILFAIVPVELVSTESIDCIERNWVVDSEGRLNFCQLLVADVDLNTGERRIRAWRMVNLERGTYEGLPYAAAIGPHLGKRMIFLDRDNVIRDWRVGFTTETVTQFDPEVLEQEKYPKQWRRELGVTPQPRSRVRGR